MDNQAADGLDAIGRNEDADYLNDLPPAESVAGEVVEEPADVFEQRVTRIQEMMAEDPAIRDRVLSEMYVTLAEFSEKFREMEMHMAKLGPGALLKMMTGRGGMPMEDDAP